MLEATPDTLVELIERTEKNGKYYYNLKVGRGIPLSQFLSTTPLTRCNPLDRFDLENIYSNGELSRVIVTTPSWEAVNA